MKLRTLLICALALVVVVTFSVFSYRTTGHWRPYDAVDDLYAQTSPIPSQFPVFGAAVITAATTSAGLPAVTAPLRYYITQAQCINVSASTVVAGGIVDGNGSTPKFWVPCPAAGANTNPQKYDPPIRITAGNQVALMTGTAVQQVFFYVTGYTAR